MLPISSGYRRGSNKNIGYNVSRHSVTECFIKYCTAGIGWFEQDGKRHVIQEGDLIICNKNIQHAYGTSLNNPWTAYWTYFTCDYLESLFPKLSDQPFLIIHLGYDVTLIQLFKEILLTKSYGYALPYLFHTSQTLGLLLSHVNLAQLSGFDLAASKYGAIIAYMNEHLHQSIDLTILAQQSGLTKDHFIRLFYASYGYTPFDYFIRLKMQTACDLLLTSDYSIKKIAASLGYEDAYYFSRIFKKKIGVSPKMYRINR